MTKLFTIQDDTVYIDRLTVSNINGDITINGTTTSYGSFNTTGDIKSRNITADTLYVKELVSETTNFGNWYASSFTELNGKGISWSCEEGSTRLVYRTDNRLWSDSNIDINAGLSYMIDNIPVLTSNSLGATVTKSNIRQLGALTALSVVGPTSIGGFAYFNDKTYRLGLGTSEPSASISILDNNVEIAIGSPAVNLASFGTYSNHDLQLTTDNTPRITIKHSGEVHIGNEHLNSSILKVFGKIQATAIETDIRITRSSSVEFTDLNNNNIYDKGLEWKSEGLLAKLILRDGPLRLWSSESIDIADNKTYRINGIDVISSKSLGAQVLYSNLVKVGKLTELEVNGSTKLTGDTTISNATINLLNTDSVNSLDSFSINVNQSSIVYASLNEITIGSKQNAKQTVKLFGKVAIGISNPDSTVDLAVNGDVSFNNKKFVNGNNAPVSGSFSKGDICWNQTPTPTGYVGWICIISGTPGEWKPFGLIGS